MAKRLAIAAAVTAMVGTSLPAPPASAQTRLGALVVSADRTAWTVVTIPRRFEVVSERATLTGGGRYAGFLVSRNDRRFYPGGAHFIRPFHGETPLVIAGIRGAQPAGRYRVLVMADRPVEVTIPLRGFTGTVHARATREARSSAAFADMGSLPGEASQEREVEVADTSWMWLYFHARVSNHQASEDEQCLTEAPGGCILLPSSGFAGVFTTPGAIGDGYWTQMALVANGHHWPGAGRYRAVNRLRAVATAGTVRGLVLQVDAPRFVAFD